MWVINGHIRNHYMSDVEITVILRDAGFIQPHNFYINVPNNLDSRLSRIPQLPMLLMIWRINEVEPIRVKNPLILVNHILNNLD